MATSKWLFIVNCHTGTTGGIRVTYQKNIEKIVRAAQLVQSYNYIFCSVINLLYEENITIIIFEKK